MKYIIKKIVTFIVTIFLVTILTFTAFHIVPGDPARLILGTNATEEKVENLRDELGINESLTAQYGNWMKGFVTGDYGDSIKYRKPVKTLIASRLPVTLYMGLISIVLTLAFGIPLGVLAAYKKDSLIDKIIHFITVLGISIPEFFLSILMMWFFGIQLKMFHVGGYISYAKDFGGFLGYIIYPAIAIAIPQNAILAKYVRTAVIGEQSMGYVRTARGKGLTNFTVMFRHIFRNAIVSLVPLIGMMVASVFSGSIIIEQVFGVPGIGNLLISSVTSRDFPLAQTLVVLIAVIVTFTNLMVDIVLQFLDPRIRLGKGR